MKLAARTAPLAIALFLAATPLSGSEREPFTAEGFEKLHALIKRHPHESRWMEIDWYPSVWEGRQKAAAEGKPLFIWAGSGGAPAAGC